MPSLPRRGRRSAPIGRGSAPTTTPANNITFGGATPNVAILDDGEYTLVLEGARAVQSKTTGALSVVLAAKDSEGSLVKIRPLLVASSSGDSTMILENRDMLAALAGVDGEEIGLDPLLTRLKGEVEVELAVVSGRDGRDQNDIVAVIRGVGK